MKSSISSLHAPGKMNVPAGVKSKVAIAARPTKSFVRALKTSLIFYFSIKIYLYKSSMWYGKNGIYYLVSIIEVPVC